MTTCRGTSTSIHRHLNITMRALIQRPWVGNDHLTLKGEIFQTNDLYIQLDLLDTAPNLLFFPMTFMSCLSIWLGSTFGSLKNIFFHVSSRQNMIRNSPKVDFSTLQSLRHNNLNLLPVLQQPNTFHQWQELLGLLTSA